MRHFEALDEVLISELFEVPPEPFTADSDARTLGIALGATLYMPGTRPALAQDIERCSAAGVVSVVLCLEDAIADGDLESAERNIVEQVSALAQRTTRDDAPLLFIRVRTAQQIGDLVARLGAAATRLSGFVLPKFTAERAPEYFDALDKAEVASGVPMFAMPVLESHRLMYRELRLSELLAVAEILDEHRDRVLALRFGAADLAGLFGLRRGRGVNVYDVGVVRDVIADVVNVLGRMDGTGFVITGPVWEHFPASERLFKPQLRSTPFAGAPAGIRLRRDLITADHDELLREVALDKANGLLGKTVIHPSHVAPVHAMCVVSHEEYDDALAVRRVTGGGASRSSYRNKMNEAGPHSAWARITLERAAVFGVSKPGHGPIDLLAALSVH